MRRRTRTITVAIALTAALASLTSCGGRTPDGSNPGNPAGDTTTTIGTTIPSG